MADETSERAVSAGEVVAAQDALATEVGPEEEGLPVVLQRLAERVSAVPCFSPLQYHRFAGLLVRGSFSMVAGPCERL